MSVREKPKVLLVDDEASVVKSLSVHLRKKFDCVTATSGADGLEIIGDDVTIAAVVSDMRMPGMNGAEFLSRVREASPLTTRLLLTGQTDLESAIRAINDGQIFRFLTKPVAPNDLRTALTEAVRVHNLETSEADLLENTLQSSIKVLTDVLSLVNPEAFSRASRLSTIVELLCAELKVAKAWQYRIAAMLSQLGFVALAPEVAERINTSAELSTQDRESYRDQAHVARDLIASIPRLGTVASIVGSQSNTAPESSSVSYGEVSETELGAELLHAASEFDRLVQDSGKTVATKELKTRAKLRPRIILALENIELPWAGSEVLSVSLNELKAEMVLRKDVRTNGGTLLAPKGTSVTEVLLGRLRSFAKNDGIKEPIEVEAPSRVTADAAT